MAKQKRTSREVAEAISLKILIRLQKKQEKYEKAAEANNVEDMFVYQLRKAEWAYVQQQQKLDQDADAIDANSGYLNDMSEDDLDEMYEKLFSEDQEQLDLPEPPNLEE